MELLTARLHPQTLGATGNMDHAERF
jgi:hypothetical protein